MNVELRPFQRDDREFVLSLAPRFVAFPLPAWRTRDGLLEGIAADLRKTVDERPERSFVFIAVEGESGDRVGLLHLERMKDFFTTEWNCHISDLAVVPEAEGQGVSSVLLEYAERWAREQGCVRLTLGVFEGNARAQKVYTRHGFGPEMIRMVKPVR